LRDDLVSSGRKDVWRPFKSPSDCSQRITVTHSKLFRIALSLLFGSDLLEESALLLALTYHKQREPDRASGYQQQRDRVDGYPIEGCV
jgi:hypothetical protein